MFVGNTDIIYVTEGMKRRFDEIAFYLICKHLKGIAHSVPNGITVSAALGNLIWGMDTGVLSTLENTINLDRNIPTNDELVVYWKYNKLPVSSAPVSRNTFYKALKRYKKMGETPFEPTFSQLQHRHMIRFLRRYRELFGKKDSLAIALRVY